MGSRRTRGPDRAKLPRTKRRATPGTLPGSSNRLLDLLPTAALARLKPHLEPVHLHRGQALFRAHEPITVACFPVSAVVSLVSTLRSGESLEVGLIGWDGLAGPTVVPDMPTMPCDAIVQIPGLALRMSAEILRQVMTEESAVFSAMGQFAHLLLARSVQISVCNMFHAVEQRCIRWLLTVSDLSPDREIPLTHDLMATMLGVHRPTVTLVLRSLHAAGLVAESRGQIAVLDRPALDAACCECYRSMRDEKRRLLGY